MPLLDERSPVQDEHPLRQPPRLPDAVGDEQYGAAAHLAGVVASYTTLPVIGVPINATALNGMDALLSTVQMPSGIPVATMAVNGAKNAAVLVVEIFAVADKALQQKLTDYRADMVKGVEAKADRVKAQL